MNAHVRRFDTGATRDLDQDKYDYEAFLSPLVIERFGQYMHKNRKLPDGSMRDGDNWQAGIPLQAYMKSGWRHMLDWWKLHRGLTARECLEDAICGLLFNAMGYLHEVLKAKANRPNSLPTLREALEERANDELPTNNGTVPEPT